MQSAHRDILQRMSRTTTTITTGQSAASGWTVTAFDAVVRDGFMSFRVNAERTGGTITVPTSGDIGNVDLVTLPTTCRGTVTLAIPVSSGATGRGAFGHYVPSTGVLTLAAVAGSTDIVNTNVVSLGGTVMLS